MTDEEEKAKKLLKRRKWADLQHAIHDPNYKDPTLLDEDADEWLIRLNSYQYPLERSPQEMERRREKEREKETVEDTNKIGHGRYMHVFNPSSGWSILDCDETNEEDK